MLLSDSVSVGAKTTEPVVGTSSEEAKLYPKVDFENRAELLKRLQFSVDLKDLRSFQCHEERPRKAKQSRGSASGGSVSGAFSPWIRLMGTDGSNYVPLYFREGGLPELIAALQRYTTLKRSAKEHNLILFTDEQTEALQQSVSLLFKEAHNDFFSVSSAGLSGTAQCIKDLLFFRSYCRIHMRQR